MFIPFFIYIKNNFFTYFSMYFSVHPVMPPFIHPLRQHTAFTHYVSHCRIHFTTQSTFTFGLSLTYFCLYCVCPLMACYCAAIISDSVYLFILASLSHSNFSSPATSSIWFKNSHVTSSVSRHYFAHFFSLP